MCLADGKDTGCW